MQRHSLRKRVEYAFALCVVGLSVVWGFAFYGAIRLSEDRVVVNQLRYAAESYPAPTTNLRGYDDVESLPEALREWARKGPAEGTYEFVDEELHVAVIAADNAKRRAFVVLDVSGIEAASSEDWWLLLIITAVVGSLGALGFGLGVLVMRRAVAPVVELATAVAQIDLEQLSAGEHKHIETGRFARDEVGALAGAIEKMLERIRSFVARERDFTASASHELRTPITVITGAVELLEQGDLPADDRNAVERIRRAIAEMSATIEMFLCIARDIDDGMGKERIPVTPTVRRAIEQQRYLLDGKSVDVEVDARAEPVVCGHPQAYWIAVNNLVRNAFEQTLAGQGPIAVRIGEHELMITNRSSSDDVAQGSPGPQSPTHGYGLGLGIVQRLCERNGWSFSLDVDEECVTACLSWGEGEQP